MDSDLVDTRSRAAEKYRLREVRLLIVAEAPPCAVDRYFYFEEVTQHDWLFRYVCEGMYGERPDRENKADWLGRLRADGVFLIDLHEANISQPSADVLARCVCGLIERCRAIAPRHIVLVKSIVYDVAYQPLAAAGLPVIPERIPFPSRGQQKKFLEGFRHAVETAGVRRSGCGSVLPARGRRA